MSYNDCTYYELENNGVWPFDLDQLVRVKSKKKKDTFLGYSISIEIQFNVVTPNLPIPEKQVL